IDNTVYREEHASIEAQIVNETHRYCRDALGIDKEQADALFRQYGSTIEGLRQTIWKDLSKEEIEKKMNDFYHKVYDSIDPSRILDSSISRGSTGSTGYTHAQEDRRLTRQLLQGSPIDILIASNSPSWHVRKVLRALGLAKLPTTKLYTPDRLSSFPTKHHPKDFFATDNGHTDEIPLMNGAYQPISFIDDSLHNLEKAQQAFPDTIRNTHQVHLKRADKETISDDSTLSSTLLREYGLLDPSYQFSQVKYLETKNVVDRRSIHAETWNQVVTELSEAIRASDNNEPVRIVDLGAGLLSILDLMLHGEKERGMLPLSSWGFLVVENVSELEVVYEHATMKGFHVRLLMKNFSEGGAGESSGGRTPNLIVGCCFADLMDPNLLVADLIQTFSLLHKETPSPSGTLIYFPITFAAITQFLPACPFESRRGKIVPSDTVAFRLYSDALTNVLGHSLDPFALIDCMEDHGMDHVHTGPSNWRIDPERDSYLYDTMLYFFGSTAGPVLLEQGYDGPGWMQRARDTRPAIQVTNQDLLFRMKPANTYPMVPQSKDILLKDPKEILFTEPYKVTTVNKKFPAKLGSRQVLVRSSYSLISSGTELKIFKGSFDDDALDVNIQDMADERMAYPLSYGYCLVGRIVDCGDDLPKDEYLDRLVFTFSPHATHVVTDADAIQFIPAGIDAKDAIFMPSVETALSLVHDAHVRLGENVAVYGQGLIGLLVTALLRAHADLLSSGQFGSVTVFDMLPDRLAAASAMGASQALFPGGHNGPFDVSIEVSGNARALQSAIDCTRDGGRVIVGSWYGNSDVSLKLGIDFHRSHKTIQTSQVSEIPAELSKLWSKERRFELAWDLVKEIRPSRLLTKVVSLDQAQVAYDALDSGTEIAVAFDYSHNKQQRK
ncbi:MAG: hypothetical protein SGILL_007461, partial [Bacillariaceae sp.]